MAQGTASLRIRVRYAETDQMGFAHHSNHLIWCEAARTHYLREAGVSYRELEAEGLLLAVTEARVKFRNPARYDEEIDVTCWVRELRSRSVTFGYAMKRQADGTVLATAQTVLIALDSNHALSRIPEHLAQHLVPVEDPLPL